MNTQNQRPTDRAFTRASLLLAAACLLGGLAFLLAQELRITDITVGPDGKPRLQYPADTNSYYILYRGGITNIVLPSDAALGTNGTGQLTGPTNTSGTTATLFPVPPVPPTEPWPALSTATPYGR